MPRRLCPKSLYLVALLLGAAAAPAAEKPNVLFIAIDDLNQSVGALGGTPVAKTPNIDRLAERGVLFTNAHCAAPGCNPSRTAVMTGLMPTTSGLYHNMQEWRAAPRLKGVVTLPEAFRAAGYETRGGGKLYHAHTLSSWGYEGGLEGGAWDEFFPSANRQMPQEPKPDPFPANGNKAHYRGFFDWVEIDGGDEAMADTKVVEWAEAQLSKKHEQPLFLGVGIYRPHVPWYTPKKYFDLYPPDDIELPDVAGDVDDIPEAGRSMTKHKWHQWLVEQGKWRDAVHAYLASASYADAMVGRLIKALDAGPLRDNTIVVLWSDHGYHLGHKQHWEKFALWEQTTQVPLIVAGSGVEGGGRCAQPVSLVDLYPTLAELCGVDAPVDLDGQSLVKLLRTPEGTRPRVPASERVAVTTHGKGNHAVRSEHWRYIRYADGSEELYDHRKDPEERNNLVGDENHREVVRQHAVRLPEAEVPMKPDLPRRRAPRSRGAEQWVLVSLNKDQQLLLYALDKETGELELRTRTPTTGRPGSIGLAPDRRHIYVAMRDSGSVAAFRIGHDGQLTPLGEGQVGEDPSYVSVHRSGEFVASAYYAAGKVAVHRINDDGSIVPEAVQIIETDEKAHAAVWDRTGSNLFIPHTRPDTIYQFGFDPATGTLSPNTPVTLRRDDNTGPRHLWFHPAASVAYSSDEQGRSITSYAYDARSGSLTTERTWASFPDGYDERGSTADIEVHPSGKFVYIANRGHNSIAGFAIDPTDRTQLELVGRTPTEAVPRSFNISPDGKFIVAAGQQTGKLAVFRVADDGALQRTSTVEAGATPWWVQFVDQPAKPEKVAARGWSDLFDGKSLAGWRGYQKEDIPPSWEVRDDSIFCNGKDEAHLITEKKYGDFELTAEWKISKGGNSGVLLRVVEVTPWPATSGLEVQVIDRTDGWEEVHGYGLGLGQAAGALYAIYPSKEEAIKKAGEWNTMRVVMDGSEVALWQNGVQLVDADMESDDWKARLAKSKFAKSEHFNKATTGHIALQNYRGAGVWFRNLKIRELTPARQ